MIKLNNYINEAWSGVKKQVNKVEIEVWCDEMGIENYTINSQGEIDVNGGVFLTHNDFKELPYKFGDISGCFEIEHNSKLTSLKNCPNYVGGYFSCGHNPKLNSLEGCPKIVSLSFWCRGCGKFFNEKYIKSMCPNIDGSIYNK